MAVHKAAAIAAVVGTVADPIEYWWVKVAMEVVAIALVAVGTSVDPTVCLVAKVAMEAVALALAVVGKAVAGPIDPAAMKVGPIACLVVAAAMAFRNRAALVAASSDLTVAVASLSPFNIHYVITSMM